MSVQAAIHHFPPVPAPLIEKANNLYSYLMYANAPLGEQLEAVYRYTDEFNAFLAPLMSCGKGCSHCCHIDVQITVLEAEYIQVKRGIPAQVNAGLTHGHREACPFLAPWGACSIYEARPLICRLYHVAGDPENCKPGRDQMLYVNPKDNHYGNDIFANLMKWLMHVAESNPECRFGDIRDFFPGGR